jgi:hypothetical protein
LSQSRFPSRIPVIGAPGLTVPRGVDPNEMMARRQQKALGRVTSDPKTGVATTNCPYCAIYMRKATTIDVTKFVDSDGQMEYVVFCAEGHRVKFKSIPQWREERQRLGLQIKG